MASLTDTDQERRIRSLAWLTAFGWKASKALGLLEWEWQRPANECLDGWMAADEANPKGKSRLSLRLRMNQGNEPNFWLPLLQFMSGNLILRPTAAWEREEGGRP